MSAAPGQFASPAAVTIEELIGLRHAARGLGVQRNRIRAAQNGADVAPFKGRGMEFEESRRYQPGDDVRSLDWRVTARTGKPYTKLFREERERPVYFCVDLRRPMFFATRGAFKSTQATRAAALLAWGALNAGDRVGALIFGEAEHHELRAGRGKRATLRVLSALADHPAWQGAPAKTAATPDAARALLRLRHVVRPGSLIFLLSDFAGFDAGGGAHLKALARHNEVVLVWVTDALERELPPPSRYAVSDGTATLSFDAGRPAARAAHRDRFLARETALAELARGHRMNLLPLATDADLVATLREGLARIR